MNKTMRIPLDQLPLPVEVASDELTGRPCCIEDGQVLLESYQALWVVDNVTV